MRHSSVLDNKSLFAASRDLFWISGHPTLVHTPAVLLKQTEDGNLRLKGDYGEESEQTVVEVPAPGVPVHPSSLLMSADLMSLGEFSEAAMLHTVRTRYLDGEDLYTQIGSAILLSVNPMRPRNELYSVKVAKGFQQESERQRLGGNTSQEDPSPHLFKLAEDAYRSLLASKKNQEIIISGISGSGKTMATRLMIAYLANAGGGFKSLEQL